MLLALLLLLAATTAALEQDGKDYDLYTTASALRNLAGGFASEVEVTADGRVKKLIFDGTADLLAEARALVNALGVTQGEGCEDRDCAAKELVNMMRGTVDARRRTAGEALDLAQLRIATTTRGHFHVVHTRDSFVGASLEAAGTFEEPALRLMLAVVRPGDVVVDAGANLGAHLVPLAVAVADGRHAPVSDAGRLVAFEPQALPHAQLHASLLMLGSARIPSAVVAYRAAAGAKDGGVASIPTLDDRGAPQNFAQLSLVEGAFHGRPDADEYENYTVVRRRGDQKLSWRHPTQRSMSTQGSRPVDRFRAEGNVPRLPIVDKGGRRGPRGRRAAGRREDHKKMPACLVRREQPLPRGRHRDAALPGCWLRRLPPRVLLRRALSQTSLKRGGGVPRGRRGPVGLAEPAVRRVGRAPRRAAGDHFP